jgi:hypothetical protein
MPSRHFFRACAAIGLLGLACGFAAAAELAAPTKDQAAYFEQHVRPLLVKHCYECHSAESKILQGGLLLDSRPGWQKGGDSGPVIVPGKPDDSLLVRAVRYAKDEFVHMPPKGKLSDKEIDIFAEWVRLGAPDPRVDAVKATAKREINIEAGKQYWAFQPLQKVVPPTVRNDAWCRTPVDRFIQAKLEAAEIAANPQADARTLLRRAYFDLLGLPPSPEEVDAFTQAANLSEAYPALLDKLLESPHFGERWGRHWLDLARFGESHGFEQDYDRPNAYHYRDYVIEAFNRDQPYDEFVRWQLAGDEYEPSNPQALKATGFLAAGVHATQITASQAEKERYDELDDMARTVGTTFLGLTVGCARCHDHKYDPITNADYYRIAATFTTTVRSDYDVKLEPKKYEAALAEFEKEQGPRTAALADYERRQMTPQFDRWLAAGDFSAADADWTVLVPLKADTTQTDVRLTPSDDGEIRSSAACVLNVTYNIEATTQLDTVGALRIEALTDDVLPERGPGIGDDGRFDLRRIVVTAAPAGKPAKDEPKSVSIELARSRTTNGQSRKDVPGVAEGKPNVWAIGNEDVGRDQAAVFEFDKPLPTFQTGTKLTVALQFNRGFQGLGRFRLAVRPTTSDGPILGTVVTEPARQAAASLRAKKAAKPTAAERKALFVWRCMQDVEWRRLRETVSRYEVHRPQPTVAKMLISSEGVPAVRLHTQGPDFYEQTFVLRRGDPNQKVEEAKAGFLQVLMRAKQEDAWRVAPPPDVKTSYRRRALAEWLTDVEHGAGNLLARVIVNRLWYYHLGQGLVANPSDFGVQSGGPSHPELLDYLAGELIRNQWRLKPIHKLIMTSAVYMQTAATDAARRKVDVENRLCWHRNLRRLEGEAIRDSMLALSGAMDPTMFGPGSMKPDQPRRSIYFFFKRSKLPAMLSLFDGPDTLQDLAVRSETTVAPQALWMMNNAIARSYATGLAKQIAPAASADVEEGVVQGYRYVLARKPTADELRDSAAFVRAQVAAYRAEGKAAEAESTAWTDFCQVLFGLNEFAYVE